MSTTPAISRRHPAEAERLGRAAVGDRDAADSVLSQLGSANQWFRQIMAETIQDSADLDLWRRLLTCLALHRWGEQADCCRRAEREASERIDAALVQLFVEDTEAAASTPVKLAVLHAGLTDPERNLRSAAASLLGLRGDARGIESLIEAAREGEPDCRLRALTALGKLKDERGGRSLVEARAADDEALHWEASRALGELGRHALPALTEALKFPHSHVRWHAVRALGSIGDAQAAAGLAEALDDADYGVRWAAAEALAGIGAYAVGPILERLTHYALTDGLYPAAHHALHQMRPPEVQARLRPQLDALRCPVASAEAPAVAYRLIQTWER